MKKIWTKIAVLVAALCLTLTCAMFAACGEQETTYTVKVVLPDADETPVEGVELTFCDETDETKTQTPVKTNELGIAKITCETANYRVKITDGIPEGYTLFDADSDDYLTKNWNNPTCIIVLDEAAYTYTVTVTLPDSTPVSGVSVIFTPDASGVETVTLTTGADGKATTTLSADTSYLVTLDPDTLPEDYTLKAADRNGISTLTGTSINFVLEPPVEYTFSVTGPEGVNLEGIEVSYSATAEGSRTLLGVTDANGVLTLTRSSITKFAFIKAPEGYVYDQNYNESNSPYLLSKGTIRFTLLKNNALTLEEQMTDSEISAFYSATRNTAFRDAMKEVGRAAYSYDASLAKDEIKLYSFKAEETETYNFYANFSDAEITAHNSLNLSEVYTNLPSKSMAIMIECIKGETYYFSVKANSAQNVRFVVVTPPEKNDYTANGTGTYKISIKDGLPAMLYFRPQESGEYTISIQNGEHGYFIQQFSPVTYSPIIGQNSENGTMVMKATHSELFGSNGESSSTYWIFRFTSTAESPSYPIELTVTITRTGDAIEKTSVVRHAEVTEKRTKYADQTGKLTAVGITGDQVVKGTDGYYHYRNANGPIVVIKLKGEIAPYYVGEDGVKADFSTLDQSGNNYYNFYTNSDDLHDYFVSYARFLRGYTAYDNTTIEVEEYYLKYVNKDGVYPLTDELKVFLEYVAKENASWISSFVTGAQPGCLWLFSAYYYDNASTASTAAHIDLTVWKKEN